ncbi:unnamed protein product (macronuclear) [Paramecium tetraurelia]|uniref:Uncharacterized protein n=1 Tax=Paramecium tetraurelia TaxID=5888 RepID=A0C4N5_PARTE|nr:uncharacterized protein GSPATT00006251001 [Paramecium tetraurelia]CAK65752.1 unnamed protein product [Paramecium tetraurelia]|eukprot:XP_001433149.1 hypothetical protein (macronuclear) [Paramecium tetraurelia strain d4-2]
MKLSPICQTLMHSKSNPLSPVIQNMKKHSIHSIENEKKENHNQLELRINQLVEENKKKMNNQEAKLWNKKFKSINQKEQNMNSFWLKKCLIFDFKITKNPNNRPNNYIKNQQTYKLSSKIPLLNQQIKQKKFRRGRLDTLSQIQQDYNNCKNQNNKFYKKQEDDDQKQSYLKAITDLERTIQSLQNQLQEKEDSLRLANEDINQWKIKFSKVQIQQKQVVNDKEKDQKIQMLIDEIERLNDLLGQRNDEIYTLKRLAEKTAQLISISQRAQRSASGQKYK